MGGSASAYEALGLEPGAAPDAVERAYKELIKRYHPDRADGDAARAAQINQAYCELCTQAEQPFDRAGAFDLGEALYAERRARRRRVARRRRRTRRPGLAVVALVALAGVAFIARERLQALVNEGIAAVSSLRSQPPVSHNGSVITTQLPDLAGPLDRSGIAEAVQEASKLVRSGDTQALVGRSRQCHREFRDLPSLAALDRCAAFDNAAIEFEDRALVQDGGEFASSAVAARQIAAAKLLSANYETIEDRLDRIRAQVQRLVLLQEPPPMPALSLTEPASGATGSLPPLVSGADGPAPH